jgi:hypothetical protein
MSVMSAPPESRHDKAIVTLAVGEEFVAAFLKTAAPTWKPYCERHGYDLIVLDRPIDPGFDPARKSLHWQKLLIGLLPQLKPYRRLVWLDTDILINYRQAPCIVAACPPERIGVVDISAPFHAADEVMNRYARYLALNYLLTRRRDPETPKAIITDGDLPAYYRRFGLPERVERFINTGVMVFEPARHARFLAECYAKYERDFLDFENTPVSYELQVNGLAHYLDPRFNLIWAQAAADHYPFLFNPEFLGQPGLVRQCVNAVFRNGWFVHFAGGSRNPLIKGAAQKVDHAADSMPALVFPEEWMRRGEFLHLCRLEDLDEERRRLGDGYMVVY